MIRCGEIHILLGWISTNALSRPVAWFCTRGRLTTKGIIRCTLGGSIPTVVTHLIWVSLSGSNAISTLVDNVKCWLPMVQSRKKSSSNVSSYGTVGRSTEVESYETYPIKSTIFWFKKNRITWLFGEKWELIMAKICQKVCLHKEHKHFDENHQLRPRQLICKLSYTWAFYVETSQHFTSVYSMRIYVTVLLHVCTRRR